jgi:two-component system cell cycle response regulator
MLRPTQDRILLIGDARHDLQPAVLAASPGAHVVSVPSVFDGIAELSARRYTTVLAAAEPIERRPESAVRTLRELTGDGRLLLFGHPTLEPLSRKMLTFGVDDYLITPTTGAELQQMLGAPSMRMADVDEPAEPLAPPQPPPTEVVGMPDALPLLAGVPLAEVVLDALLTAPQEAPAAAVAQVNAHLGPAATLAYTAAGQAAPTADHALVLSHVVRAGPEELGSVHLTIPLEVDETAARHVLAQLAHVFGKVAALQDRHNRLQRLAISDELTGLYNGRYFRHYLTRIVERARTHMFPVTLLLFDIDNFKKYNDQYGHGVGDEILRQTAALMKKCVRDHDLVARISGDEFAVVFWEKDGPRAPRDPGLPANPPGRPPQTPVQILERFRRLLATQTFTGLGPGGQGTLTISGGLAVYPWHACSVAELIEAADKALMFTAKKSGKNSIYLVGGTPTADGGATVP